MKPWRGRDLSKVYGCSWLSPLKTQVTVICSRAEIWRITFPSPKAAQKKNLHRCSGNLQRQPPKNFKSVSSQWHTWRYFTHLSMSFLFSASCRYQGASETESTVFLLKMTNMRVVADSVAHFQWRTGLLRKKTIIYKRVTALKLSTGCWQMVYWWLLFVFQ